MTRTIALALAAVLARPVAVDAACSISSNETVAFGNYNVYNPLPIEPKGSFTYSCSLGTSITIEISPGGSMDIDDRKMTGPGGATLKYQLYRDITRLLVWGNTAGTRIGPIVGSPIDLKVFVWARVFAQQDVKVGDYQDQVTITINY